MAELVKPMLATSADWRLWILSVEMVANSYDVWELIDPETPEDKRPERLASTPRPRPEDTNYDALLKDWQINEKLIDKQKNALQKVTTHLKETVHANLYEYWARKKEVKDQIKALKDHLAPSNSAQRKAIRQRWDAHMKAIKKTNHQVWIDEYINLCEDVKTYKVTQLTDAEDQRNDFYEAIRQISPEWANPSSERLEDMDEDKRPTSKQLAQKYLNWLRNNFPQRLTSSKQSSASFLTFQGKDEDGRADQTQSNLRPRRIYVCDCKAQGRDRYHCKPLSRCPNLNPARRKRNYQMASGHQQVINQFWENCNPQTKSTIEAAIKSEVDEKNAQGQSSSSNRNKDKVKDKPTSKKAVHHIQDDDSSCIGSSDDEGSSASSYGIFHQIQQGSRVDNRLLNEIIIDSGSGKHITNNKALLRDFQSIADGPTYLTGGGPSNQVVGYGKMRVHLNDVDGRPTRLKIRKVAYIPEFPTTVLSSRKLEKRNVFFSTKTQTLEIEGIHVPLAEICRQYALQPVEDSATSNSGSDSEGNALYNDTTQPRPTDTVTAQLWHERLGHANAEALNKMVTACKGGALKSPDQGPRVVECEACATSKVRRQISRRSADHRATRPWQRVHIDFFTLDRAYNGMTKVLLFKDAFTKMVVIRILPRRSDGFKALVEFELYLWRQYGLQITVIRIDWESALRSNLVNWADDRGILVERSAVNTPQQNPTSERGGGMIFDITRSLTNSSGFQWDKWPEIVAAAVYLHNLTPRRQIQWKTPIGTLNSWLTSRGLASIDNAATPSIAHLKRYGCRAYALTSTYQRQKDRELKLAPRAHIGFLIGYDSTNIFRIWVPSLQRVLRTRDVTFDESRLYRDGQRPEQAMDIETFSLMDIKINDPEDPFLVATDIIDSDTTQALLQNTTQESLPRTNAEKADSAEAGGVRTATTGASRDQPRETSPASSETPPVLSPTRSALPATPPAGPATPGDSILNEEDTIHVATTDEPPEPAPEQAGPSQRPVLSHQPTTAAAAPEAPATSTRSGRVSRPTQRKVESEQQQRRRSRRPKDTSFVVGTLIRAPVRPMLRSDMPPEPKNWKEVMSHPYKDQWIKAALSEVTELKSMKTWEELSEEAMERLDDAVKVIGLTWAFKYKVDQNGYVTKFKARLCVRGDQQPQNNLDTYAATLAARTFRAIMAITACFDLETRQLDAKNAFPHACLDEEVYVWEPPGWPTIMGIKTNGKRRRAWKLMRALYGLRRSPLLWNRKLSKAIKKLGMTQLHEDACVFLGDRLLVFFYVDDIVILYRRMDRKKADEFIEQLKKQFNIHDLGELRWFLGTRVIRDRNQRLIWLSLDNYITEKIKEFRIDCSGRRVRTPLPYPDNLLPSPDGHQATHDSIHQYLQKVGSINYAACQGRPDVAKAASRLAEFNSNPSSQHHEAAHHCLKYLHANKDLAICFGNRPLERPALYCASDAAFADDKATRYSSQGYTTILFGGPIDWKANKQTSVVTSSTEAELVALSAAVRNYMATLRLIKELTLTFDEPTITVFCDNQQTKRLLESERPQATSKLRHVDIHHLWIRQTVQRKEIDIQWVATTDMVSDGMTKALSPQKHETFVRQLGVTVPTG
ncbi:hypothetical protein MRS44_013354 [Fusarium solani]|uniref:uncharacterized protein n=1 Tax=Fusarium solani TaxID=169388 RepID=UPI0032C47D35|nr:hypothetical protein MRS44_013354 [Fusarium solani]